MSEKQTSNKGLSGGSGAGKQPKDKSDYQITKEAGYNNTHHMMQSYGIKHWEDGAYEEAKAIIEGFRQIDQQNYEASQKK